MFVKTKSTVAVDLNSATPSDWKILTYREESSVDKSIIDYKNEVSIINQLKQDYPNQITMYNNTGANLEYLIINNQNEEDAYNIYTTRAEVISGGILGFVLFPINTYLQIKDVGAVRAVAVKSITGETATSDLRIDLSSYRPHIITRT